MAKIYESINRGRSIHITSGAHQGRLFFGERRYSKTLIVGVLDAADETTLRRLGFQPDQYADKPLSEPVLKELCESINLDVTAKVRAQTGREICASFVERIVERQPDFKAAKPLKSGIWVKADREEVEADKELGEVRKAVSNLDADVLRKRLTKLGVKYPATANQALLTRLYLAEEFKAPATETN